MSETCQTEIIKIIENALRLSSGVLKEDSSAENVDDWDSLGQLTLFLELESQLGIKFSHEEIINTNVMADIIALVESKQP